MRFLHTSDWHVGKTIRDRDRTTEFAAALEQVVDIAKSENADAVLVSGDVFEHRSPGPDAERVVYEAFARIHAEGIRAVVIAGNHDSPLRWSAVRPILRPLGVSVVAEVAPPEQGTLIEVPSRDGAHAALVACVPFAPERVFGDAARLFDGSENWPQDYAQGMGDLLAAMAASFRADRVNVLMAHLFAGGAELGGGETPNAVTLDYAVSPARLPGTATYIALGHVHRPQRITASPSPTYYSGSLLQLDFGERDQRKSVRIVEAAPSKPARVTEIPIAAGRHLVDVSGTLDEVRRSAATVGDAYLRVRVHTDGPVPGLADQVRQMLPNAVDVRAEYEREPDEDSAGAVLMGLRPRDQYAAFHLEKYGVQPTAEVLATFDELHAAVDASS